MLWDLREEDADKDYAMMKALIKAQFLNPAQLVWGSGTTFLQIKLDGAWSMSHLEKFFCFCREHGYEATLSTNPFREKPMFIISRKQIFAKKEVTEGESK